MSNGLKPELTPNTSIKIIGLGGVGSIVARYLSIFLASLDQECRLVLIDGDSFEMSNANRMIFGDCGNKAEVIRQELVPRFVHSKLSIHHVPEYFSNSNSFRLLQDGDIVFLCVDNHATRKLVGGHCEIELNDVVLISGGNDGVNDKRSGTYGTAQIYIQRNGEDLSPPIEQYHPEIATPADKHPEDKSCTDLIATTPQILFTNLAVASAMLNTFLLHCCDKLHYSELAFDIAAGRMRPVMPLKGLE